MPNPYPVVSPDEIPPITPKYIRIDTAHDVVARKIWFCLMYLDETKDKTQAVGVYADKITGRNKSTGKFLIEGLPPYIWDVWNGYLWEREEDAVQAREIIRLKILMDGGNLIEDI